MNIYLLQRDEIFWKVVQVYLKGMNARTIVLPGGGDVRGAAEQRPDLVIAGRRSLEHPLARTMKASLLVIDDSAEGAASPVRPGGGAPTCLRWPFTRREFLETTAEVLHLDPRKDFRALIRIGMSRNDFGTLAESRDFSISGMSFTSATLFSPGLNIVISLSLPGDGRHLVLHGRVVRLFTDEEDGSTVYGVEFRYLGQEERDLLREFILS